MNENDIPAVRKMMRAGATVTELARKYGVYPSTASAYLRKYGMGVYITTTRARDKKDPNMEFQT